MRREPHRTGRWPRIRTVSLAALAAGLRRSRTVPRALPACGTTRSSKTARTRRINTARRSAAGTVHRRRPPPPGRNRGRLGPQRLRSVWRRIPVAFVGYGGSCADPAHFDASSRGSGDGGGTIATPRTHPSRPCRSTKIGPRSTSFASDYQNSVPFRFRTCTWFFPPLTVQYKKYLSQNLCIYFILAA